MRADRPKNIEEWMRGMEARVAQLDQRIRSLGAALGDGTGVDGEGPAPEVVEDWDTAGEWSPSGDWYDNGSPYTSYYREAGSVFGTASSGFGESVPNLAASGTPPATIVEMRIPYSTADKGLTYTSDLAEPGTVTFSDVIANNNFYVMGRFYIDNDLMHETSTVWTHRNYTVPAGTHELRWQLFGEYSDVGPAYGIGRFRLYTTVWEDA